MNAIDGLRIALENRFDARTLKSGYGLDGLANRIAWELRASFETIKPILGVTRPRPKHLTVLKSLGYLREVINPIRYFLNHKAHKKYKALTAEEFYTEGLEYKLAVICWKTHPYDYLMGHSKESLEKIENFVDLVNNINKHAKEYSELCETSPTLIDMPKKEEKVIKDLLKLSRKA